MPSTSAPRLPLTGVGVLVTRPAHQAQSLCAALSAMGAQVSRLAAVEILPITPSPSDHRSSRADFVIFTSANAARLGVGIASAQLDAQWIAIGPATAAALHGLSLKNHGEIIDSEEASSEGLIAHACLRSIEGRRVLIVKGRGGRGELAPALGARGAHVESLDVYERVAPDFDPARLHSLARALMHDEIHVVTATSVEIAQNLWKGNHADWRNFLARTAWLAASERIAGALESLGARGLIVRSRTAQDHDLAAALAAWNASASVE